MVPTRICFCCATMMGTPGSSIFNVLIISDVEHIFMYLLAICMSSFKKCLFRSAHFKIFTWIFFCVCVWCCIELYEFFLYFWILSPYQIYDLQVFSVGCLFTILENSLLCRKAFWFDLVPSVYFCFCCLCFWYLNSANHH